MIDSCNESLINQILIKGDKRTIVVGILGCRNNLAVVDSRCLPVDLSVTSGGNGKNATSFGYNQNECRVYFEMAFMMDNCSDYGSSLFINKT